MRGLERQPLRARRRLSEHYAAADHVEVQPSGMGQPTLDTWFLERSGMERRIEVRTFSFIAAPFLVLGTDRIATIQRRLGRMAQQFLPLTILEAPMALPRMAQSVQWHKYRTPRPGAGLAARPAAPGR